MERMTPEAPTVQNNLRHVRLHRVREADERDLGADFVRDCGA